MASDDRRTLAGPTEQDDQRQEFRLNQIFTVFIEMPSPEPDQDGAIIVSTSLDASANGLRVIADQALAPGSLLRTCVQTQASLNSVEKFILISEIMWCRPYGEDGEYLIGLSLFESTGSDIVRWKEAVALWLEAAAP